MKVFINFNSNFRATLISRVITYFLYLHSKMHDMNFESYPRKEKKNISFSQSFYFFGVLQFGFLCLFWAFFCCFGLVLCFPPATWNHGITMPQYLSRPAGHPPLTLNLFLAAPHALCATHYH